MKEGKLEELVNELIDNKNKITVGEAIRAIRKARGWQQKYLSEMAGISNSYLCDIEKNRALPSIKTIMKIGKPLLQGIEGFDWQFFLYFIYVKTEK